MKHDLRIGNLLNYHGQMVHVIEIRRNEIEYGYFKDSVGFSRKYDDKDIPFPIRLREETLIKFGGEKTKHKPGTQATYIVKGIKFDVSNGGNIYHAQTKRLIEFVHTLQNLVYVLKDEELTLN